MTAWVCGAGVMVVVVTLPGPEGTSEAFMVLPQHCHCGWGNQGLKLPSKSRQSWTHTHLPMALLTAICLLCLAKEQRQRKVEEGAVVQEDNQDTWRFPPADGCPSAQPLPRVVSHPPGQLSYIWSQLQNDPCRYGV